MIRFTWLQSRTQTALAAGALVVTAIVLALTGPNLVHLFNANVVPCAANGSCDAAKEAFLRNDKTLRAWLDILVVVIPGIIGIFWGAPLIARELESGTHRLAWTQSVTRARWLAVKLAVVGLTSMAVAGLFGLMVTWWASPLDTARASRFAPLMFDERGIVIVGYTACAFALGATAGLVIRRTVPAMATTLVAFGAARVAVIQLLRPRFVAALHRSTVLEPTRVGFGRRNSGPLTLQPDAPQIPNAWILSTHIVDRAGHGIPADYLARVCPRVVANLAAPPAPGGASRAQVPDDFKNSLNGCIAKVATKYHLVTTYQPANRYWIFQWYELALFVGVALALCGFCVWWVRRRLA